MKKNKIEIYLLAFVLIFISCKKEIETVLEPDLIVIDFYYGEDNYEKNIRDNSKPIIVKERNILEIDVNKNGECKIEGKIIQDSLIVHELKKYLTPNPENSKMPQTIESEFTYAGKVTMNEDLLISALFDKDLSYKNYSRIRNKIYSAYNETRNEFTKEKYGKTLYELMNSSEEIDDIKWSELAEIIPFNYVEVIDK